jgi:hypothetical protein
MAGASGNGKQQVRCGRSRRSVDQGHFTENAAGRKGLDDLAVALDLDLAGADHIHKVALVALRKDDLALLILGGRESRIGEKLEIDCSNRHSRAPLPYTGLSGRHFMKVL